MFLIPCRDWPLRGHSEWYEGLNYSLFGDFLGGPVVKTLCFHWVGASVWSLVKELKSHMSLGLNE